jgi:hypothetical protein
MPGSYGCFNTALLEEVLGAFNSSSTITTTCLVATADNIGMAANFCLWWCGCCCSTSSWCCGDIIAHQHDATIRRPWAFAIATASHPIPWQLTHTVKCKRISAVLQQHGGGDGVTKAGCNVQGGSLAGIFQVGVGLGLEQQPDGMVVEPMSQHMLGSSHRSTTSTLTSTTPVHVWLPWQGGSDAVGTQCLIR